MPRFVPLVAALALLAMAAPSDARPRIPASVKRAATRVKSLVAIPTHLRRARARRFDARVLHSRPKDTIAVGKRPELEITSEVLGALIQTSKQLTRSLHELDLQIVDPRSGKRRALASADIKASFAVIDGLGRALSDKKLKIDPAALSLSHIAKDPRVAALITRANKSLSLERYRLACSVLEQVDRAYVLFSDLPGQKRSPLRRAAKELGVADDATVVVAARRQTPRDVVEAARTLSQNYFDDISRLIFDPVLAGDKDAEARVRAKLDAKGNKLLDRIVRFRDKEQLRVFALRKGRRDRRGEDLLAAGLQAGFSKSAGDLFRKDFYASASKETKESFLPAIALGSTLGFAMDHMADWLKNPAILKWKPAVLGGWDDAVGGGINVFELWKNTKDKKKRIKQVINGAVAVAFGVATSVALSVPFSALGGVSLAGMMLDPNTALATRVAASAAFGVLSSGATLAMSFLPARLHVQPILKLVENGTVAAPKDKGGALLQGRALRRWAWKKSFENHLSLTAQRGGFYGVWLSGLLTGGFGIIPGWGGAAASNVLLSIGGAGETITTGGYLFAREGWERRQITKAAKEALSGR